MILTDQMLLRAVLEPWDSSHDFADIPPRIDYRPVFAGSDVHHTVGPVTFTSLKQAILAKAAAMAEQEKA